MISNVNTAGSVKCFAYAGGSTENGSNVQQVSDSGSDTQRWIFEPAGNGNYFIHTKQNGYMDAAECVNGKLPVNDTNIRCFSFTGETNQQFNLVEQEPSNAGSVLSEGNMTLIIGIAAAAVFGLGGFFAGNAFGKKKPATANSNDDE